MSVDKRAVLFLSFAFLLAGAAMAAEEEGDSPAATGAPDTRLDAMKKGMAGLRDQQRRRDQAQPLVERSLAMAESGNYREARAALEKWEEIDPGDARIPRLRRLILKMEVENSEDAKSDLLREYVGVVAGTGSGSAGAGEESMDPAVLSDGFCIAAAEGDSAKISTLLSKGADAGAKDRFGTPALIHASGAGQTGIVRELLKHGAEVNARGFLGITALVQASANGHADTVRVLLDAGADPKARTDSGITALDSARFRKHKGVEEILLQRGAGDPDPAPAETAAPAAQ